MRPPGVFTIFRVFDLVRYGFRLVYVTRVSLTTADAQGAYGADGGVRRRKGVQGTAPGTDALVVGLGAAGRVLSGHSAEDLVEKGSRPSSHFSTPLNSGSRAAFIFSILRQHCGKTALAVQTQIQLVVPARRIAASRKPPKRHTAECTQQRPCRRASRQVARPLTPPTRPGANCHYPC